MPLADLHNVLVTTYALHCQPPKFPAEWNARPLELVTSVSECLAVLDRGSTAATMRVHVVDLQPLTLPASVVTP